jgi:hypothetical protein
MRTVVYSLKEKMKKMDFLYVDLCAPLAVLKIKDFTKTSGSL